MSFKIIENRLNIVEFQTLRLMSGMEPLDSSMLKKALAASVLRLSAVENGEVVGMVRVAGDGVFVFVIADLLVRPDKRGDGIGTALVNHALDMMVKSLPTGRWATVTLVSADGKESFYERLGFHTLPHGEVGHGMQTYIRGEGGF